MKAFGITVVGFVLIVMFFLIVVIVLVDPWPLTLINRQYFGWRHKSAKYYADFTAACDSVLATHPLGTNAFILIPVTDPSLPKIITEAKPLKIKVGHQWIWMLQAGDTFEGFGLTWGPQWGNTNVRVLHTTAESDDTVVYTAIR